MVLNAPLNNYTYLSQLFLENFFFFKSKYIEGSIFREQPQSLFFVYVWPKGHREPCNEVGSLILAELLISEGLKPPFKLGYPSKLCPSPSNSGIQGLPF